MVRQIEWLRGFGVADVVLAVGYLKHKIFEALGDGRKLGVRIFYSEHRSEEHTSELQSR